MNSGAHFETLNPSRNGASCNVEQIKADRSVSASGRSSALVVNQSVMRERNLQLIQEVCKMRSGFVQEGKFVPVSEIGGNVPCLGAKSIHFVGYLPLRNCQEIIFTKQRRDDRL